MITRRNWQIYGRMKNQNNTNNSLLILSSNRLSNTKIDRMHIHNWYNQYANV